MRPDAPLLNVPPKLYKHFAAATLVITACAAMFGGGEATQAIERKAVEIGARKVAAKPKQGPASDTQPMVSGMRDNRASSQGYEEAGPGPLPVMPISASALTGDEPGAKWLALGSQGAPAATRGKRPKKLPPVLPPGAPGTGNPPGAAPPSTGS